MTDFWKRCEGQVIAQKYPLQQFLAETQNAWVFLTYVGNAPAQKAVIKFVPANPITAGRQLSRWARASRLSHTALLRLLDSGRCQLQDRDLLYVVLEFADEDLSQLLPVRALTLDETNGMIAPVLEALAYLHTQGLAHGHIKPANIHAIGDQVKLSIDTATIFGEKLLGGRDWDPYDAPELTTSPVNRASDAWSLGITLVEALTQHTPQMLPGQQTDPELPANLPEPFLKIARNTLQREPGLRWVAADVAAHLKLGPPVERETPSPVAANAVPKLSPLEVPLSPERGIPVAKLPAAPPRLALLPRKPTVVRRKTLVFPNYTIPVLAGLLFVVALLVLPKFLRHAEIAAKSDASTPASAPPNANPAEHSANQNLSAPPVAKSSTRAAAEKAPPVTPAPAKLRTEDVPAANTAKLTSDSNSRGEVLDKILPEPPGKSLNTIHGVVRVVVRVHVDAAGNVSQADLESPGPSRYFADMAIQAAQKWVFSSPVLDGKSVASDWLLRFDYTQSGVRAVSEQISP